MSRAVGTAGQGVSIAPPPLPKDFADQLTLFQPGGWPDYPHHIITSPKPLPHGFSDLPTALIKEYKEQQLSRVGKMCNFHPSSVKTKFLENCIADIYFLPNHYLFAPAPLHLLLLLCKY